MYDFCFTYPYAIILALGGFAGFVSKGSLPSLLGGLGSAGILTACAQISLNAYHKGQLNKGATATSLLVATGLTILMGSSARSAISQHSWHVLCQGHLPQVSNDKWYRTGKVMPAGLTAVISAVMVLFYIWNLIYIKDAGQKSS